LKLKIKNYKFLKIKKDIKNNNLLFICNTNNKKNLIAINQKLKGLKINEYKVSNSLMKLIFNKSIFYNLKSIINSLTAFLTINKNINFQTFKEKIPTNYILLSIKLNNKFYYNTGFKNLIFLNNKTNNLILILYIIKNIGKHNLLKISK